MKYSSRSPQHQEPEPDNEKRITALIVNGRYDPKHGLLADEPDHGDMPAGERQISKGFPEDDLTMKRTHDEMGEPLHGKNQISSRSEK